MFNDIQEIVNLTPHEVNVWVPREGGGKKILDIPPSGNVARMHITAEKAGTVFGIPVVLSVGRKILGLPAPKKGVLYLVSSVIAREVRRPDVVSPDTTDDGAIKDGSGNIVGVTRFQSFCSDTEMV